ncbi:glucose inhibited division protein a [Holotrichia oblita]|nr:glucose inhibited division protein a [Holotrichia oblita]
MGIAADKTLTHLRMLNGSKGPAVHSLRAQVDKYAYRDYMKSVLEKQENLFLRQGEVKNLLIDNGRITGVETVTKLKYYAKAIVLACGVYLNSTIIIGDVIEERGPVCFPRSNYLAKSLTDSGISLRRFKTGTPARVKRSSVDLSVLESQPGENTPYSFSVLSDSESVDKLRDDCYLGYTNTQTHSVISENLSKSPKYGGLIHGTGARYCPSVEDKIVRFKDKERHQFFLEPEGVNTEEMYVQGLSTGLPCDIQLSLYRTIKGFENVQIMRDAYAIEYECIDPQQLFPTLMSKKYDGLFFAGQINGTSGYEEAAAQGLVAGINAALYIENKEPLVLTRENSYIGVLIDDLCTEGTQEPYRMMTSRAEFRLILRQDNADLRLTPIAAALGLASKERIEKLDKKLADIEKGKILSEQILPPKELNDYFKKIGEPLPHSGLKIKDIIRRSGVSLENFTERFDTFKDLSQDAVFDVFIQIKYEGYLQREKRAVEEIKRIENMPIPKETDYLKIEGLRNEAKEKLQKIRPLTIGQAGRINGVTPADVNVLLIRLKGMK